MLDLMAGVLPELLIGFTQTLEEAAILQRQDDALLWVPTGGHGHPVKHSGLASQCAGLWVVRASIPAPRTN
jgi:hypothetical protein